MMARIDYNQAVLAANTLVEALGFRIYSDTPSHQKALGSYLEALGVTDKAPLPLPK